MMFEQLCLENFQEQTFGASDFRDGKRAKTLVSPVNKKVCKPVNEADCFMKLLDCLPDLKKKISPNGWSQKMLKIYCLLETDLISQGCCLSWGGVGYDVEWQLFNTKYSYIVDQTYIAGIPQNRERVYLVCHLANRGQRKVLPIPRADEEDNSELKQVGKKCNHRNNPNRHRVYDESGIAPTLNCMGGGGLQPCIVDDTNMGFDHGGVRIHEDCPTLRSERSGLKGICRKNITAVTDGLRIRRLTPRETWRLQGFTDEQFDKAAAAGVSDTQLYKQAGNAVSVNITYAIGLALKNTEKETKENHENS